SSITACASRPTAPHSPSGSTIAALGKEIRYLAMVLLLGIDGDREACVRPNDTGIQRRAPARAKRGRVFDRCNSWLGRCCTDDGSSSFGYRDVDEEDAVLLEQGAWRPQTRYFQWCHQFPPDSRSTVS